MRRIGEGLKFYTWAYQCRAMAAGQFDFHHKIMVFRRTDFVAPPNLSQISQADLEENFLKPGEQILAAKIREEDFRKFYTEKSDQNYQSCYNPKIVAYRGKRVKRKEFTPNFFLLEFTVERFSQIELSYTNEKGERKVESFEGSLAMDLQLAADYLEGVTPMQFSRNLGNVKATPFCAQHLPDFTAAIKETTADVSQNTRDSAVLEMIRAEPGYPSFLDEEFERDLDRLLEIGVNEYEDKFESAPTD